MRITGEHFKSMKKQTVTQSLDTTPHIPIQLSASRECNFHAGIESWSCWFDSFPHLVLIHHQKHVNKNRMQWFRNYSIPVLLYTASHFFFLFLEIALHVELTFWCPAALNQSLRSHADVTNDLNQEQCAHISSSDKEMLSHGILPCVNKHPFQSNLMWVCISHNVNLQLLHCMVIFLGFDSERLI